MATVVATAPCPCGSGQSYQHCCQPLHQGQAAADAQALMRSRYCAYTLGLIDYLVGTTLPAQQALLDREAMRIWSEASTWLGLTVEEATAVTPGTERAKVTFTARWAEPSGQQLSHRECSDFVLKAGRWYFIDPNHPLKTARNEPCPCNSGRKFKQCCQI